MAPRPAAGGLRGPGPPSAPTLPAPPLETGAAAAGGSEGSPSLPSPRVSSHRRPSRPRGAALLGGRGVGARRRRENTRGNAGGRTGAGVLPAEGGGEATAIRDPDPSQRCPHLRTPLRPGPRPAPPLPAGIYPHFGPCQHPTPSAPCAWPGWPAGWLAGWLARSLAPRPERPLSPAAGPAPQAAPPRRARPPPPPPRTTLFTSAQGSREGEGRRPPPRGRLGSVVPRLPPSTVGRWLSGVVTGPHTDAARSFLPSFFLPSYFLPSFLPSFILPSPAGAGSTLRAQIPSPGQRPVVRPHA